MNRLPLGALALLAATQVAGCIITSDNNDDEARITVNWELRNVGSNVVQACPSGYDTVALYSQPVDANGNDIGSPIIDLFRCNDGTGVSAPLPPTTYLSWIEVTNTNNTAQYARSLGAYVDVTVEDKTLDAAIFLNGGYFQVDWKLEGEVTRTPFQCSTIPGTTVASVELAATLAGTDSVLDFQPFRCDDYTGITPVLMAGIYNVTLAALRAPDDFSLGSKSINSQQINGPNLVTRVTEIPGQIGPVTIPLDDL